MFTYEKAYKIDTHRFSDVSVKSVDFCSSPARTSELEEEKMDESSPFEVQGLEVKEDDIQASTFKSEEQGCRFSELSFDLEHKLKTMCPVL